MIVRHYTLSFRVFTVQRNFMGIELDVIVGHPEHDLLFVATQVARAAGLVNAKQVLHKYRQLHGEISWPLGALVKEKFTIDYPVESTGKKARKNTVMMTEHDLYRWLLRGNSPASEPFRKWVTEEVLPTIRKTGKYDAEQSSNRIALGIMDELICIECRKTPHYGHNNVATVEDYL